MTTYLLILTFIQKIVNHEVVCNSHWMERKFKLELLGQALMPIIMSTARQTLSGLMQGYICDASFYGGCEILSRSQEAICEFGTILFMQLVKNKYFQNFFLLHTQTKVFSCEWLVNSLLSKWAFLRTLSLSLLWRWELKSTSSISSILSILFELTFHWFIVNSWHKFLLRWLTFGVSLVPEQNNYACTHKENDQDNEQNISLF